MDVARVEAKHDPSTCFVQHARLAPDRPAPGESPLVLTQLLRRLVGAGLVALCTTRRSEVLRLLVPEIGLGSLEVRPIGLKLEPLRGDRHEVVADPVAAGLV